MAYGNLISDRAQSLAWGKLARSVSLEKMMRRMLWSLWLLCAVPASAGEVSVAVAANVIKPMTQIAVEFERVTGHRAVLSSGATGKFYAQIRNGAPFAVFLAADATTPARLESEGLAVPATRFAYATGRLVLWSAQPGLVDAAGDLLRKGAARKLAIANPRLAPYGLAAKEVLQGMGLFERWQPHFVQGENIGQTYQFVVTGNAPLGFVAMSQVMLDGALLSGSAWVVPEHLHTPLRQEAVLLKPGADNPAARAWLDYLRSEPARAVLRRYGYGA